MRSQLALSRTLTALALLAGLHMAACTARPKTWIASKSPDGRKSVAIVHVVPPISIKDNMEIQLSQDGHVINLYEAHQREWITQFAAFSWSADSRFVGIYARDSYAHTHLLFGFDVVAQKRVSGEQVRNDLRAAIAKEYASYIAQYYKGPDVDPLVWADTDPAALAFYRHHVAVNPDLQ